MDPFFNTEISPKFYSYVYMTVLFIICILYLLQHKLKVVDESGGIIITIIYYCSGQMYNSSILLFWCENMFFKCALHWQSVHFAANKYP